MWGEYLFNWPFNEYRDETISEAQAKVDDLAEDDILSSAIERKLNQLAAELCVEVPTLLVSEMRGKRRTAVEERSTPDGYEEDLLELVDVSIPFRGDPNGFRILPSNGTSAP